MKEENKEFFKQSILIDRVQHAMAQRGIDFDTLCDVLNRNVKYSITKSNLKLYISDRTPNANFLIALSRSLGVTTDFLLGENNKGLKKGINQRIYSKSYRKYAGKYNLYFYGTVNCESGTVTVATLEINFAKEEAVTMKIATSEGGEKLYYGDLQISEMSPNVFIVLNSDFGEQVSLTFYDEPMNCETFQCAVGAMLSISAGDLKRAPVLSRFIITGYDVDEAHMKFIKAHLKLNTKYINISPEMICTSVEAIFGKCEMADRIADRLKKAFYSKRYYAIEDSFIVNTLRKDENLSLHQADELIAELRNNSLSNINFKINKSLDSTVYRCTNPKNISQE